MIPHDIVYDSQASPPHWTDHQDQVIEKGTLVRVRIKGLRPQVAGLYAIATINEVCVNTFLMVIGSIGLITSSSRIFSGKIQCSTNLASLICLRIIPPASQ
jgi:hypothetical protein